MAAEPLGSVLASTSSPSWAKYPFLIAMNKLALSTMGSVPTAIRVRSGAAPARLPPPPPPHADRAATSMIATVAAQKRADRFILTKGMRVLPATQQDAFG